VLGHARIDPVIENVILRSLAEGRDIRETARETGVGSAT
jgi:hypothetical protein